MWSSVVFFLSSGSCRYSNNHNRIYFFPSKLKVKEVSSFHLFLQERNPKMSRFILSIVWENLSTGKNHLKNWCYPLLVNRSNPCPTLWYCQGTHLAFALEVRTWSDLEWRGTKAFAVLPPALEVHIWLEWQQRRAWQAERKDEINEVTAFTVTTAATRGEKNNQVLLIPRPLPSSESCSKIPVQPPSPDPVLRQHRRVTVRTDRGKPSKPLHFPAPWVRMSFSSRTHLPSPCMSEVHSVRLSRNNCMISVESL